MKQKKRTIVILGRGSGAQIAAQSAQETNHGAHIIVSDKLTSEDVSLDMDARVVTFKGNSSRKVGFDSLVYCASIVNRKPHIEGILDVDIVCASDLLEKNPQGQRALILGCGRDGIWASQHLRSLGFTVFIMEKAPRILPRHSFEIAQRALRQLHALGINTLLNEEIVSGTRNAQGTYVVQTSKGRTFETDLVVSAIGAVAQSDLLIAAGALTTPDLTLFTDDTMCTSLSEVYACGEGVSAQKILSNNRHFRPSSSMIERGAQVAGCNAALPRKSTKRRMRPCAGLELISIGNLEFARTGLSEEELRRYQTNNNVVRATVTKGDHLIRLYANRDNRFLVSAEIIGTPHESSLINLLSLFILKNFTVDEIIDLDVPSSLREASEHIRSALNLEFENVSGENIALWLAQKKPIEWIDVGETPSSILDLVSEAKHVPLKELKTRQLPISKEQTLVLTSHTGKSAIMACRIFKELGHDRVYQLDGGTQSLALVLGNNSFGEEC